MPLYEYKCEKCGHISTFVESMFEQPSLFSKKKRCERCGSKKLKRVYSSFGVSVSRTTAEMLDELKHHAKIQFVPPPPKPPWGDGPPPGGCPYEKMIKEEEEKKKASLPPEPMKLTVSSQTQTRTKAKGGILSWLKRSRSSKS